jgi:hypothetical protein
VIEAVVAPVDQSRLEPVAVNKEDPQLLVILTTGAAGTANGAAVAEAGALAQPPMVCVTVYVPGDVTVIVALVAPVDQRRFNPVALNTDDPQLFVTVATGADGSAVTFTVIVPQSTDDSITHPAPSSPLTK